VGVDARIDVITLAVSDLEQAHAFYRDGLGLESRGIVGAQFEGTDDQPAGAIAMFELEGGGLLNLYPRSELAKDARVPQADPAGAGFSLGQLVGSREAVDALLGRAQAAGATVTEPPHERPWGIYSGYFRDPDGHLWEVIWNPGGAG